MGEFDDILNTVLQNYTEQLYGQIFRPSALLQRLSPEWRAEQERLDRIGPEHQPGRHEYYEVRMAEFMPKFVALVEEYGAELTSYEDIDIRIGTAWRSWNEQ